MTKISFYQQKGSTHTLLVIGLVVILAAVLGFVFWQNFIKETSNDNSKVSDAQQSENMSATKPYAKTTVVPDGWKKYSNDNYKFSISYPSKWTVQESEGDLGDSTEATDKSYFSLGFRPYVENGPMEVQHELDVSHETLEQAVASIKSIVKNNDDADSAVRMTITNEENFTYQGNKAVSIEILSDYGTKSESISSYTYIAANGMLYTFKKGMHDKNAPDDKEVLTVFESLKLDN